MQRYWVYLVSGGLWKVIEILWGLPGRFDDTKSWWKLVSSMDLSIQGINDWGPLLLCTIGVLLWISEKIRENRNQSASESHKQHAPEHRPLSRRGKSRERGLVDLSCIELCA